MVRGALLGPPTCACSHLVITLQVRGAFLGPPAYLLLLYLAPLDAREAVAFCAIPLLGCGACALPHFRALFSAARPVTRHGQSAALVAATAHHLGLLGLAL